MAAIARSLLLLAVLTGVIVAAEPSTPRAELIYVANALASGNPTDALTRFDKATPDYDKFADYFRALTESYEIESEIDLKDEGEAAGEASLKADWILTLSDRGTSSSIRRNIEVTVKLRRVKEKWRIVSFSPIELFNPQERR